MSPPFLSVAVLLLLSVARGVDVAPAAAQAEGGKAEGDCPATSAGTDLPGAGGQPPAAAAPANTGGVGQPEGRSMHEAMLSPQQRARQAQREVARSKQTADGEKVMG